MSQEIADSKLIDTWGSGGLKIEPDISKIIEGWQLGEQPPHEYMNWLQNTFGSKLNHILKNGVASWNNETEYLAGSSTQHNGNVWLCKTTNTNSEPTNLNANWEKVAINKDLTVPVDTLADLKNISYPANTVWASGYHAKNDGAFGSNFFRLKGTKTTETDNGGTVIIATINAVDYVYELQYDGAVNVKWFGAMENNNIALIISNIIEAGHKDIFIPSGSYFIESTTTNGSYKNGIVLPYVDVNFTEPLSYSLYGEGTNTKLLIKDNNTIGIVCASSYTKIYDLEIKSNSGVTGSVGLGLIPEDMTQTTTQIFQNFNLIDNVLIRGCSIGMLLKAGPDVSGVDSGCWYNKVNNSHIYYCTTGIQFDEGTNASSSGPNRNQFNNVRLGQATTDGIVMNAGGTNVFNGCSLEGITGYGVKIIESDTWGGDLNSNTFTNTKIEAVGTHLYNDANYTEIYGSDFATFAGAKMPMILLGGSNATVVPQIQQGIAYQANGQIAGMPNLETAITAANGLSITTSGARASDFGYKFINYPITLTNTSSIASIFSYKSRYNSFGHIVDWSCRIQFQADASTSSINIAMPLAPENELYTDPYTISASMGATTISIGGTPNIGYWRMSNTGTLLNGKQYITVTSLSGNFNSSAAVNYINLNIRYFRD